MANPFDAPFGQTSKLASGNTTFSTKQKTKTGRMATVNPFNQSFNATGDAPNQDYSKQAQDARSGKKTAPVQPKAAPAPKKNIFNRAVDTVKNVAKDTVKGAIDTGEKTANTVAAGGAGLFGLGRVIGSGIVGGKQAANKAATETDNTVSKLLDSGLGGKGGYLNSKQAKSSGTGTKGLKNDFLKPASKAAADIAPWVIPVGLEAKGANIAVRAAKEAALNAGVSAGTDVAAQAANNGKVDLKQTAKNAALGGVLGGAMPLASKGLQKAEQAATAGKTARKDLVKNSKVQAIQDLADKMVDPAVVEKHPNATPQHVKSVNDLITNAHKENGQFQSNMQRIAGDNNLSYHPGPVKNADRAFSKVMADYGGNVKQMKDTVRGTIHLDDPSNIKQVTDAVGKEMRITNVKNLYDTEGSGYRDVKLTVETPSGHKGEIIIATPEMLKAKNDLGGHKLYEISRDTTRPEAERLLAAQKMNVLYDKAHADAMSRLASGSDLPNSSTSNLRASAGETLDAPSLMAPTSKEAPVTTLVSRNSPDGNLRTASTTPSASKNVGESSIPSTVADNSSNVKSKPGKIVYRAGQEIDPAKVTEQGISITPSKHIAHRKFGPGSITNGKVHEYRLSKDAKIMPFSEIPKDLYKPGKVAGELEPKSERKFNPQDFANSRAKNHDDFEKIVAYAKEKGYDGVNLKRFGEGEIRVFDAKHITKSTPVQSLKPTVKPESAVNVLRPKKPVSLTASQTAHMTPIGGYTHSSHMLQEYADMLRGMDTQVKGGQMVSDGAGNYRRTSEHSKFYRDFYAENKKPPTKADYREEAKRQLESGHAMYDASDDYHALINREAKPIPRIETTKPSVPVEQGVSKVGKSVQIKAVERGLKNTFGESAGYNKITIADQAKKAVAVTKDRELLDKIISGDATLPDGLRATALIKAVESDPVLGKDPDIIRKLAASNLASESSYSAQELRLARERYDHSPVEAIKTIAKARADAVTRKTGKTADKAVKEVTKQIKQAKLVVKKEDWSSFIDGLKC